MDINDFVKHLNSVINESSSGSTVKVQNETVENVINKNEIQENRIVENRIVENRIVENRIVENRIIENSKKLKLLIVSTHTNQINGYSKVIYNIISELAKNNWLDIVHFGTQKLANADLARKYPSGVKVIDGTALEKPKMAGFAFSELPGVINTEKPNIVFIYNDLAVISGYIEEIRKSIQNRFFKIWAYVDIAYQAQPQSMIDIINRDIERVFCFTKFWKDQLKLQGITRPVDVMPHAVNTQMIRVLPRDLARQSLGLPKEVFLFSSFNRNTPRKRLDILIMAFVKLIVRFPTKNIFMLVVSDKGDKGGFPIFEIYARELKLANGSVEIFGNRLLVTNTNGCYKDDDINILYNCADVGVSCAEGEGFGLCTFEQMSLGIPQIVPEVGGYMEYCNENNSSIIKPKMRYYIPQAYNIVTGEGKMVTPEDVAKAMEQYVFNEDLRKLHGKLGKEKVEEYSWEKSCSTLIKRLKMHQEDED